MQDEEETQAWIAARLRSMREAKSPDRDWEALKEQFALEAEAREPEEEPLSSADVEAKPKPQPERATSYLSSMLFGLLGLLVVSQMYVWMRLRQAAASGQEHEARAAAVEAELRKDLDKESVALDELFQQMATQDQAYQQQIETLSQAQGRAVSRESATAPHPFSRAEFATPRALTAARRDLQTTGNALQDRTAGSLGKLSPSGTPVARDHNEIVKLRKLGERDYFEFTLVPSEVRQEVAGGIRLQLTKIDLKNLRCTLNIYADDYELPDTQGAGEALSFPIRAGGQPVDLVINEVKPDHVVGYLSALKGVLEAGK